MLVLAVKAEKEGGWWGEVPNASRKGIVWETSQLPWDVQQRVHVVKMAAKLRAMGMQEGVGPRTFAGALAQVKICQYEPRQVRANSVLDQDLKTREQWQSKYGAVVEGVRPDRQRAAAAFDRWKKGVRRGAAREALERALKDLEIREATSAEGGRQSNQIYIETMNIETKRGESHAWRQLVSNGKDVIALRRLKMGMIRGMKGALARKVRGWTSLDEATRERLLECDCGMHLERGMAEDQDALHVFRNCRYTEGLRRDVLSFMDEMVQEEGEDWEKEAWEDLGEDEQDRLNYSLSTHRRLSLELDQRIKRGTVRMWVEGLDDVSKMLSDQNKDFGRTASAAVTSVQAAAGH